MLQAWLEKQSDGQTKLDKQAEPELEAEEKPEELEAPPRELEEQPEELQEQPEELEAPPHELEEQPEEPEEQSQVLEEPPDEVEKQPDELSEQEEQVRGRRLVPDSVRFVHFCSFCAPRMWRGRSWRSLHFICRVSCEQTTDEEWIVEGPPEAKNRKRKSKTKKAR